MSKPKGDVRSVFESYEVKMYPYRYAGVLQVVDICGGIPSDPKVAEGWINSKLEGTDDLIRQAVVQVMLETGKTVEEATAAVDTKRHLNVFKRDPERGGEFYINGNNLKAALKEGSSVAVNAGNLPARGWGLANTKGFISWLPEHIFVMEDRLYLGVKETTTINQRFVKNWQGKTGIQYEECVEDIRISFTVESDYKFTKDQWAAMWVHGQHLGIGASRHMGYGRYKLVEWDQIPVT